MMRSDINSKSVMDLKTHSLTIEERHFPKSSGNFILKKEVTVEAAKAICFRIPANLFINKAQCFEDFRTSDPSTIFHVSLLQMLVFTASVICTRVYKNNFDKNEFPFRAFLESLIDKDNKPTGDYRLWIYEKANTSYMFDSVFKTAVVSDKKIDESGFFVDKNRPSTDKGAAKKGRSEPQKVSAGEFKDTSRSHNTDDLFKTITTNESLAIALDCYAGKTRYTSNQTIKLGNTDKMNPSVVLSPADAFEKTPVNVCVGQRFLSNYKIETLKNGNTTWRLPFFSSTFELDPYIFMVNGNSVGYFMSRMFPHLQIDPIQIMFNRFTLKLATQNDRTALLNMIKAQENMLAEARKQGIEIPARILEDIEKSRQSISIDDDDDDDDDGEDDMANGRSRRTDNRRLNIDDQDNATVRDPISIVATAGGKVTDAMAREWARVCGIRTEEHIKKKLRPDDGVTDIEDFHSVNRRVIIESYTGTDGETVKKKNKYLKVLRDICFNKFEQGCMRPNSRVSQPQQILNRIFEDESMENMHFAVPITDTSKTLIENMMIHMTEGFSQHEHIAVYQKECFYLYLCAMDVFRRDQNLHINVIMAGGNGCGKSHAMERVLENIGKETVTFMNSSSDYVDTVDAKTTDELIVSDDASLATYFDPKSKVEKNSMAKSSLTTQVTTRGVLELEKSKDGESVRRKKIYTNLAIKSLWWGSNETMGDAAASAPASQRESVYALCNRFMILDILSVENELRSASDSMDAERMMSAAQQEEQRRWRLRNIKYRVICGWAWKLISCGLMTINMDVFGIIWKKFQQNVVDKHIAKPHARVYNQTLLWCQQLVLYDAYLRHHCTESGMFYNKTFDIRQLQSWNPICFVHHAVIAISFSFNSFVPQATDVVLDSLRDLQLQEFDANSNSVYFACKHDIEKRDEERKRSMRQEFGMTPRGTENINMMDKPAPLRQSDQNGATVRSVNPYRPSVPPNQPSAPRGDGFDATFVVFDYKEAELVHLLLGNMSRLKTKPSRGSVLDVFNRLKTTNVTSGRYEIFHRKQKVPTENNNTHKSSSLALRYVDGKIHVHYSLLQNKSYFTGKLIESLQETCFKHTQERNILIGITYEQAPWIYKAIDMKPNEREFSIQNPSYVPTSSVIALYGRNAHNKLEPHQRAMFIKIEQDIDTLGLLSYYADAIKDGTINPVDIFIYHPKTQQEVIEVCEEISAREHSNDSTEYGEDEFYAIKRYPEHFIADVMLSVELRNIHMGKKQTDDSQERKDIRDMIRRRDLISKTAKSMTDAYIGISTGAAGTSNGICGNEGTRDMVNKLIPIVQDPDVDADVSNNSKKIIISRQHAIEYGLTAAPSEFTLDKLTDIFDDRMKRKQERENEKYKETCHVLNAAAEAADDAPPTEHVSRETLIERRRAAKVQKQSAAVKETEEEENENALDTLFALAHNDIDKNAETVKRGIEDEEEEKPPKRAKTVIKKRSLDDDDDDDEDQGIGFFSSPSEEDDEDEKKGEEEEEEKEEFREERI